MDPFDPKRLEEREKQIRDMYVMRAISSALGIGAVGGVLLAIVLMGEIPALGITLLIIALTIGFSAMVLWAVQNAMRSAEEAIRKERQEMLQFYDVTREKAKRSPRLNLSEEGEILDSEEQNAEERSERPSDEARRSGQRRA